MGMRFWRQLGTNGCMLAALLTVPSLAWSQSGLPPVEGAGGPVSGPTSSDYGFPQPTVQQPSNGWTNPFKQAATAFQNAFRPAPAQYQTQLAPNDPTRLDTEMPELTEQVHLQAARLATSRGRADEAKTHYERVLKGDPTHLEALISLARIADAEQGFAAARPHYVAALNAHSHRAVVHNDFGMSAARGQQLPLSLAAFNEAVRLEPANVRYRNNLAKALMQANRWREALDQLLAAHSPAAAHYNFAFLVNQLDGPPEQVLFHARQALRFDQNFAAAEQLANTAMQRKLTARGGTPQQTAGARPIASRPAAPSNARFPAPQAGVRESRRLPTTTQGPAPNRETRFVTPGGSQTSGSQTQRPVYLPPAAPNWPRR